MRAVYICSATSPNPLRDLGIAILHFRRSAQPELAIERRIEARPAPHYAFAGSTDASPSAIAARHAFTTAWIVPPPARGVASSQGKGAPGGQDRMITFAEWTELTGLREARALEERYGTDDTRLPGFTTGTVEPPGRR